MDINKITKCEFESAYCKHLPSKLEKFYFKYFSPNTIKTNRWLTRVIAIIFMIPFLMGFIGTIVNAPQQFIEISVFIFSFLLLVFALPWLYVWFSYNYRIKLIQKELGINKYEYDFLIDKFYYEINISKYIKNKLCR